MRHAGGEPVSMKEALPSSFLTLSGEDVRVWPWNEPALQVVYM